MRPDVTIVREKGLIESMAVQASPPRQSDYVELKRRIKEAALLDRQPRYYTLKIVATFGMLAIGLASIAAFPNPWLRVLDAVFLAFVFTQIGFLAHDGGHRAIFRGGRGNDLFCIFVMNLLMGGSAGWWVGKHNAHHNNPNHIDLDPDISLPVFAFSEEQALEKRGILRFMVKYQAFFFFPLLTLEYYSLRAISMRYLLRTASKYRRIETLATILHYPLFFGFVFAELGLTAGLLFLVLQQGLTGLYIGISFAPNHKGMPMVDDDSGLDFVRRQVITSRNLTRGRVSDYVFGPLASQIEHHLFPNMPTNNGRKAELIVKGFCHERSISYHETGPWQAFREIIGHLHEVSAPLRQRT